MAALFLIFEAMKTPFFLALLLPAALLAQQQPTLPRLEPIAATAAPSLHVPIDAVPAFMRPAKDPYSWVVTDGSYNDDGGIVRIRQCRYAPLVYYVDGVKVRASSPFRRVTPLIESISLNMSSQLAGMPYSDLNERAGDWQKPFKESETPREQIAYQWGVARRWKL